MSCHSTVVIISTFPIRKSQKLSLGLLTLPKTLSQAKFNIKRTHPVIDSTQTTISTTNHISSKQNPFSSWLLFPVPLTFPQSKIPFFVLYPISRRPPPIKIQLTPIKWTDKNIPKTITRSTATIGNIIWKQNSTNKEHAAGTRLYSHYQFHNQSTTHIFSLKEKSLSCTYRIPSPQLLQINIHSTPLHSQQARPHILPPLWSWFQEKFNKQRNGNSVPQDKISQESHKK